MKYQNAKNILKNVEYYINKLETEKKDMYHINSMYVYITDVCRELGIFDWYKPKLSLSNLKDMRKFLKEAIKLGFTGYVCFKVGSSGCANGMWAHKEESINGYSPDGDFIYKSFTPSYNRWAFNIDNKSYPTRKQYDNDIELKTIKQFEKMYFSIANN